jgi:antagonist of KipI
VARAGLLSSVQDLGRFGYAHLGVSASGAADALALRAGNLLVGNAENAPAIEMTLSGGAFEFEGETVAALTGADFDADAPLWTPFTVPAGGVVRCGAARSGARCYLCVRGGVEAPPVLGSASTHLFTGLGGLEGRALRRGDVLRVGDRAVRRPRARGTPPPAPFDGVLRATPGPQAEWFGDEFYAIEWEVKPESDRMGIRLRGEPLAGGGGAMLTEGVTLGAVQVPAGGEPIVLFVEHQTTGGYPKIANVISADFTRLGQLRPRDRVRFTRSTFDQALAALRAQEEWLHELV